MVGVSGGMVHAICVWYVCACVCIVASLMCWYTCQTSQWSFRYDTPIAN